MKEKVLDRSRITVRWFHEIESFPQGFIVVIDAYAATTNIPLILSKNPRRLLIVNANTLPAARKLYPESILLGESEDLPKETFIASNEPEQIDKVDIKGRDVIWMSINGSRVLEKVVGSSKGGVLSCAFNNFSAVSDWLIDNAQDEQITIVISGDRGREVLEDKICGDTLLQSLLGQVYDWEEVKNEVINFMSGYPIYQATYAKNLRFVLDFDRYATVPTCFRNESGFLEFTDLTGALPRTP